MKVLANILDNPIRRLALVRRRRSRRSGYVALVPLLAAAGFAMMAPTWEVMHGILQPLGQIAFNFAAAAFFLHCVCDQVVCVQDPLRRSVHTNVADQLVLTGLSPVEWAWGHLSLMAGDVAYISAVYMPILLLAWFLGGTSLTGLILLLLAIGVCSVSCRLLLLLAPRSPGLMNLLCAFGFAVLLAPFAAFFTLLGKGAETARPLIPLLVLHPLLVLGEDILNNLPQVIGTPLHIARCVATEKAVLPLWVRFLIGHAVLWCVATTGFVAGRLRSHADAVDGAGRQARYKPLASTGPADCAVSTATTRTLDWRDTVRLFGENSSPRWPWLWEVLAMLGTSVLIACLLLTVSRVATAPWLIADRDLGAWNGMTPSDLTVAAWLLLVLSVGAFVFSREAVLRSKTSRQLLLTDSTFLALRIGFVGAWLAQTLFTGFGLPGDVAWAVLGAFGASSVALVALGAALSLAGPTRRRALARYCRTVAFWIIVPLAAAIALQVSFPPGVPYWSIMAGASPLYAGLVPLAGRPDAFRMGWADIAQRIGEKYPFPVAVLFAAVCMVVAVTSVHIAYCHARTWRAHRSRQSRMPQNREA